MFIALVADKFKLIFEFKPKGTAYVCTQRW